MNTIVKKMLGETGEEEFGPGRSITGFAGGGRSAVPHEGSLNLPEESKEVELATTILNAVAQLPDSPAKDKIVQAATELKQIHSTV